MVRVGYTATQAIDNLRAMFYHIFLVSYLINNSFSAQLLFRGFPNESDKTYERLPPSRGEPLSLQSLDPTPKLD